MARGDPSVLRFSIGLPDFHCKNVSVTKFITKSLNSSDCPEQYTQHLKVTC
jgi:hypothetical protein